MGDKLVFDVLRQPSQERVKESSGVSEREREREREREIKIEREREGQRESQCVCVCLLTERYLWLEHLDLKLFQFPVVHHFRTKCELGVSMRSSRLETRVH